MIKIALTSVLVDDQARALRFYTDVDVDLGQFRWLTLVSPADPEGVQLVLEPDAHPAAQAYKKALVADGIPATSFQVDDVHKEHERLSGLGVAFRSKPTAGPTIVAVFDDTCGNLIQIHQKA